MDARLFTFVSEFRGTTHVSQVSATGEHEAVRICAGVVRSKRPFARASSHLAESAESSESGFLPVALSDLSSAWCITGSCGGDFMLGNIVETVMPPTVDKRVSAPKAA
jgi:hypothetical protein